MQTARILMGHASFCNPTIFIIIFWRVSCYQRYYWLICERDLHQTYLKNQKTSTFSFCISEHQYINTFWNTTLPLWSIFSGTSTSWSLTKRVSLYGWFFCFARFFWICLIRLLENTTWKGVDRYVLFSCLMTIAS